MKGSMKKGSAAFGGKKQEISTQEASVRKAVVADGMAMTAGDKYNKHMDHKGKLKGAY